MIKNVSLKNKTISSLSLILLLAMMLLMALAIPSLAQINVLQPEKTVGFVTVAPTLIGVGQQLTCNLWVYPLPTTSGGSPYFNGFYGVTVTFVKPDGTKDTFMPTDETGSYIPGQMQSLAALYFFYKPQMAGNWSISFTMPAQNITDRTGTVQYSGCTSNTFHFTVQTEPVLAGMLNGYPWMPLPDPNVYWKYPINANNREWSQISGDWTGVTSTMATVNSPTALRWQPYGSGPNTPHIVWKNAIRIGGIIGGTYGSYNYLAATNSAVIMDGKVYVNVPNTGTFECIDEVTGQVLYTANGSITCGLHEFGSEYQQSASSVALGQAVVLLPSSYGSYVYPRLWGSSGSTWNYYDAYTGTLVRQISNCSSARLVDGTVLAFGAASSVVGKPAIPGSGYIYGWNLTMVKNNNWPTGITWIKQMPTNITQRLPSIFAVSQDASVVVFYNYEQYWGYDAVTGASLWNLTLNYQTNTNEELQLTNVDDFIIWNPTESVWNCYSIKTGNLLWATSPSVASSPWATTWTVYRSETNDLNNVYFACPDGSVYAYSLTDGHLLWTSKPIPSTEQTENAVPLVCGGMVMVDGKIYVYAGYSTGYQINPVPRFSMTYCINATTGDYIWTLNGGLAPDAAANGYLIEDSIFDGQMYCLGKGPTSTTVTAQQQVGGSVLIQGSVLDTSPVSSSADLTAMFANGVPAISDTDMSVWMDYLHMQNATLVNNPPACMGVPVTLTAVSSTGNTVNIGTVTSDGAGHFAYQWSPTTEGLYTVYATFAGTNSYFSSYADTSATVSIAATSETSQQQQTIPDYTMTIIYAAIAIIIAVVISVAIVGMLVLRKK